METIHINKYGINQDFDKEEIFDYLYEIHKKHYIDYVDAEDLPNKYYQIQEMIYYNCVDFIKDLIGEENVDDFIEYCEYMEL